MSIESIKARLSEIMAQYNGDNDIAPGPVVTYTDYKTLEILDLLIDEVESHINQAYQHQGNSQKGSEFFVENRAPGENPIEFTEEGCSVFEWATSELMSIQFTENTWQQARESRQEVEDLIAQVIRKMEGRE